MAYKNDEPMLDKDNELDPWGPGPANQGDDLGDSNNLTGIGGGPNPGRGDMLNNVGNTGKASKAVQDHLKGKEHRPL